MSADLQAVVERIEKVIEYLGGTPWSQVHPYPGSPQSANTLYADDLRGILAAAAIAKAQPPSGQSGEA